MQRPTRGLSIGEPLRNCAWVVGINTSFRRGASGRAHASGQVWNELRLSWSFHVEAFKMPSTSTHRKSFFARSDRAAFFHTTVLISFVLLLFLASFVSSGLVLHSYRLWCSLWSLSAAAFATQLFFFSINRIGNGLKQM